MQTDFKKVYIYMYIYIFNLDVKYSKENISNLILTLVLRKKVIYINFSLLAFTCEKDWRENSNHSIRNPQWKFCSVSLFYLKFCLHLVRKWCKNKHIHIWKSRFWNSVFWIIIFLWLMSLETFLLHQFSPCSW